MANTSSQAANSSGGAVDTKTSRDKAIAKTEVANSQPKTQVDLGILLEVNQKPVSLRPSDVYGAADNAVTLAKVYGKEYRLPEPITLGSLEDFNAFLAQYGASMPAADDFPEPLDQVYEKLTTLELTIEEFYVKIPGTYKKKKAAKDKRNSELRATDIEEKTDDEKEADPTKYSLAVTVQWQEGDEVELVKDTLAIRGFFCKISKL